MTSREAWRAGDGDVAAIIAARHADPFSVLGLHQTAEGLVLRAFVPGAWELRAENGAGETIVNLVRRHDDGFFEARVGDRSERFTYRLVASNIGGSWTLHDPYMFGPVLGPMDDHLLVEGTHKHLYERFGAHPMAIDGVEGVHFAVWAPNARRVSVVGDFNAWDGRRHQMRKRVDSGLWEIFAPDIGEGTVYKFEIVGPDGVVLPLKADPLGFASEMRPSTASVVARTDRFEWTDADYLAGRAAAVARREPITIYEVHLGSWRKGHDGAYLTYDEIADQLIPYAKDMGFTHIELMPVNEHPLDDSWGYQPIGLFAPTSRHGSPAGFARFVDRAHAAGLGIIVDWVPAHFPTDAHGLARFDGTPLYEDADPRRGFHPQWNTAIYDFGRREVMNFLTASALYWLDRYHIDGLRVDAVASMLQLDFARKPGEWARNVKGGNENLEAIALLQRVNILAYGEHPGALMIAEDSTAWKGVCKPVHEGGLGFGFKWNLGWMHDTLDYLSLDPIHRRWHHNELTFGLLYAFTENFILPLSHDEVVYGKRSIVGRFPGDEWQRFATLRAYYAFMWAFPGKKLLFMGQEFGQVNEWDFHRALDWHLLDYKFHQGVRDCVRDLNRLYRSEPALHARDCESEGFRWIVVDDAPQSVYAWIRLGEPEDLPVVMISNFTPVPREDYRIGLPQTGIWREVMNTDATLYGGSGVGNLGAVRASAMPSHGFPASASLTLPPLATVYLRLDSR
ncbi:MAG: 1,4-alpha-glucan branching enzyme [Rhodospirillales bacterium]|nr:1,4-alpha-glucan branching enzyme [Rhodospirillales bacterium]